MIANSHLLEFIIVLISELRSQPKLKEKILFHDKISNAREHEQNTIRNDKAKHSPNNNIDIIDNNNNNKRDHLPNISNMRINVYNKSRDDKEAMFLENENKTMDCNELSFSDLNKLPDCQWQQLDKQTNLEGNCDNSEYIFDDDNNVDDKDNDYKQNNDDNDNDSKFHSSVFHTYNSYTNINYNVTLDN
eukprot:Pgem_evm1s12831